MKREIESFEMNPNYYLDSFDFGNKTHVASELWELYNISPKVFLLILVDLPKYIQKFVISSKFFTTK
jgi:hypothetical protein